MLTMERTTVFCRAEIICIVFGFFFFGANTHRFLSKWNTRKKADIIIIIIILRNENRIGIEEDASKKAFNPNCVFMSHFEFEKHVDFIHDVFHKG